MAVNYFGSSNRSDGINYFGSSNRSDGSSNRSGGINYFDDNVDDIVEEIEYRVVSNKISKLTNPVGDKIVESTESGDIKEGKFSLAELEEKMSQDKEEATEARDVLEMTKLNRFNSSTPQNEVVVTAANGKIKSLSINPNLLDIRLDTLERARRVLQDTKLNTFNSDTPEGRLIVTDTNGEIKIADTDLENLKNRVDTINNNLILVNRYVYTKVKNYINVTTELHGAIEAGNIFNYGSKPVNYTRNMNITSWHGGYVVMTTGSITKGSLSCVSESGITSTPAKVTLYKNGMPLNSTYKLKLTSDQSKMVKTFDRPLPVQEGDYIFFMVDRDVSDAKWTVASLMIEVSTE